MWKEEDAELYEQWYASPVGSFALEQQKRLLQHMMSRWPRRGRSLLDVGCGTGLLSDFLWQGGFDLSCLDQSQAMLDYARARLGNRADTYLGVAEHLPFDDRSFDYVTLLGVLEHLADPRLAMQEAFRVAAKGVALGFLNACSLARFGQFFFRENNLQLPHGPRWLGLPELGKLLRLACAEGRPAFGAVLLGPRCTWKHGRLCNLVNSLRLPLPLGAYALVCVTKEQLRPLTGLPLRIGKVGMEKAAPRATMRSLQSRQDWQQPCGQVKRGVNAKDKSTPGNAAKEKV